MALATDIAGDYAIFDGGETITLRQIRATGVTETSVAGAINGPLSLRQAAALGGNLVGTETVWHLPDTLVGSLGVQVGDQIVTSAYAVWNVIDVSHSTLNTRWRCISRREE
jgi:hypothetical protein